MASYLISTLLFSTALAKDCTPVVHKDVVVVGGGASGTYAAVRLREDLNASVALIERGTILGGNTNTFDNPDTGAAMNFGVQTYMDYKGAKPFFERFGIPTQPSISWNSTTVYINPDTGKIVPNVTAPPPISDSIEALKRYLAVIAQWDDILLPGYWNFPSGNEIPEELLLPFSNFIEKYGLEDAAPVLSRVAGIDIKSTKPALYAVMNFGTPVVKAYAENGYFNPLPLNNSLIYGKAEKLLGDDLYLASTVVETSRTEVGVSVRVRDDTTGATQLIRAKRLLIAAPPSLKGLENLALDDQEKAIFSTFSNITSAAAIVKTNLLPDNTSVRFVSNSTTPRPYSFGITWLGQSKYFRVLFSARIAMTDEEMKAGILEGFQTLADGGEFNTTTDGEVPRSEVVAFSDHSRVVWNQTVDQLRGGFIQQMYALQGRRSTWYTGGLWCPDYSSNVWAYTDTVLPRLLNGI